MLKSITFIPEIEDEIEVDVSLENHIWGTARGKSIPVQKMTTFHIKNCINCWNGVGNMIVPDGYLGGREKWLKIFVEELAKRN